jgi:hypothetical protein
MTDIEHERKEKTSTAFSKGGEGRGWSLALLF